MYLYFGMLGLFLPFEMMNAVIIIDSIMVHIYRYEKSSSIK